MSQSFLETMLVKPGIYLRHWVANIFVVALFKK